MFKILKFVSFCYAYSYLHLDSTLSKNVEQRIEYTFRTQKKINLNINERNLLLTMTYGMVNQTTSSRMECASICTTVNRGYECCSLLYHKETGKCSYLTSNAGEKLKTNLDQKNRWLSNPGVLWNRHIYDPFVFRFEDILSGKSLSGKPDNSTTLEPLKTGAIALSMKDEHIQYISFDNQENTCLGNSEKCQNGYTFSFWFEPKTIPTDTKHRVVFIGGGKAFGFKNGKFHFWFRDLRYLYDTKDEPPVFVNNVLFHIVATWKKKYGGELYINGTKRAFYKTRNVYKNVGGLFDKIIIGKPVDIPRLTDYLGATGSLWDLKFWPYKLENDEIDKHWRESYL